MVARKAPQYYVICTLHVSLSVCNFLGECEEFCNFVPLLFHLVSFFRLSWFPRLFITFSTTFSSVNSSVSYYVFGLFCGIFMCLVSFSVLIQNIIFIRMKIKRSLNLISISVSFNDRTEPFLLQ